MFHGGTNFGFLNGANTDREGYQADVTSYDYDAPLDEAGDAGRKFASFGRILRRHIPGLPELVIPQPGRKIALPALQPTGSTCLFDSLDRLGEVQRSVTPEPMEAFDQAYGFILYRTSLTGPRARARLRILGLHHRAQVFLNGLPLGILEREFPARSLRLNIPEQGGRLDILVENMGRVNFGPHLHDRKGITGGVTLDDQFLFDWQVTPLPLDDLSRLQFAEGAPASYPAFQRASFEVTSPGDTFLSLPGWTKGVVWLNGFNLGRYWERGPQKTLYIPAPLLKRGPNELIVFELHGVQSLTVEFRDQPDLG
jgi:beta-galactosidase